MLEKPSLWKLGGAEGRQCVALSSGLKGLEESTFSPHPLSSILRTLVCQWLLFTWTKQQERYPRAPKGDLQILLLLQTPPPAAYRHALMLVLFLGSLFCSIDLCIYNTVKNHKVLITGAIRQNLKQGRLIPPTLKTDLTILKEPVTFYTNFRIILYIATKNIKIVL